MRRPDRTDAALAAIIVALVVIVASILTLVAINRGDIDQPDHEPCTDIYIIGPVTGPIIGCHDNRE